jgi:hypothetical protein
MRIAEASMTFRDWAAMIRDRVRAQLPGVVATARGRDTAVIFRAELSRPEKLT